MILGIGTDIVDIKRVEKLYYKFPCRFHKKILSSDEDLVYQRIRDVRSKIRYLAKRFSAKEAFAKSIGTGIGSLTFKDISVLNDTLGKPYIRIMHSLKIYNPEVFDKHNGVNIEISISDERNYVVAFVLIWV